MTDQSTTTQPQQPTPEKNADKKPLSPEKIAEADQRKKEDDDRRAAERTEKRAAKKEAEIKKFIKKIRDLEEDERSGIENFLLAIHDYTSQKLNEENNEDDIKIIEAYTRILNNMIKLEKLNAQVQSTENSISSTFNNLYSSKGDYATKVVEIRKLLKS